ISDSSRGRFSLSIRRSITRVRAGHRRLEFATALDARTSRTALVQCAGSTARGSQRLAIGDAFLYTFPTSREPEDGRTTERPGLDTLQLFTKSGVWYRAPATQSMLKPFVQIKRVYEPPASDDGVRVLVDRLWPRGLSKTGASVDLWLKDLAPSVRL